MQQTNSTSSSQDPIHHRGEYESVSRTNIRSQQQQVIQQQIIVFVYNIQIIIIMNNQI